MWNLFTVGSLQFCNGSKVVLLEANQNRRYCQTYANKHTFMSQEHHKKKQIIVKSTIRNTRFHLVIKEIKSSSLLTTILVEMLKKG